MRRKPLAILTCATCATCAAFASQGCLQQFLPEPVRDDCITITIGGEVTEVCPGDLFN